MSNTSVSRRTKVKVLIAGEDITTDIGKNMLSVQYTDNEEDAADDLQVTIADPHRVWITKYLNAVLDAAASEGLPSSGGSQYKNKGLRIQVVFVRENWNSDGYDKVLDTGECALDDVSCDGPPNVITLKATSAPRDTATTQTKKNQAWEAYYLSSIAKEIAGRAGMDCMYESDADPYYDRVEQVKQSDIEFLSALCHNAGISLKVTANTLVLFDQAKYEAADPVITISPGSGYSKYKLKTGQCDTQYGSCTVSYTDPVSKATYTGSFKDPEAESDAQVLSLNMRVSSNAEAEVLAQKMLRLKNKYEKHCDFTFPGDPALVVGVTVKLEGWGMFDGKYIISKAVHSLSGSSGYTTKITLRRTLEGY